MIWGRMGKRDFVIKRNKVNTSGAQQYTIMASRGDKRILFYGAFSHVFPISYVISSKMTADSSILSRNADGPKSE